MLTPKQLLDQLTTATTAEARDNLLLDLSLSALSPQLQAVITAAAIPHWFNFTLLTVLVGDETADLYYDPLLDLDFIEEIPGRGYAIHEATRTLLLNRLWHTEPDHFRALSGRIADHILHEIETNRVENREKTGLLVEERQDNRLTAEEIYHRLVSDPLQGINRFQEMAIAWANYEQSDFAAIEQMVRLANEQIDHGRVAPPLTPWVYLWQAKLGLIYGQAAVSQTALDKITPSAEFPPLLAAEIAQTYGDLYASQNGLSQAADAWQQAHQHYRQAGAAVDLYLLGEKMKAHGLSLPQTSAERADDPTPKSEPDDLTRGLLNNIEQAWLDGVLRPLFGQAQEQFTLALTSRRQVQQPQTAVRELPEQSGLSALLAASGESLLILGAPGSGKTITLLQLLDELVTQARQDGNRPIPLLLNLSSFGNFTGDFTEWLVKQTYDQYRLGRRQMRLELAKPNRFILLLDGLDEVAAGDGRERCVREMNTFIENHRCGLVVCSRIHDYRQLSAELDVAQAVVIQPLSPQQVVAGLAATPQLQTAVSQTGVLREALRSPLVLDLFRQIFATQPEVLLDGSADEAGSAAAWRREIFSRYVARVLPPEKETEKPHRRWLSFLSWNMQRESTTVFHVEELQPTWLPVERPWWQNYYGGWSSLFLGLIVGLFGGLSVDWLDWVAGYWMGSGSNYSIGYCDGIVGGGWLGGLINHVFNDSGY